MLASLIALAISISTVATEPEHIRFLVTGDDRWNTKAPRPGMDENGVNVTGLGRIVQAILSEKPNAVVFNGDLVGGGETDEEEISQFGTWFKVMQPIYESGIKVVTLRGNHEMHCPHADDVWRRMMSGNHQSPGTGPVGEEGMTFTFALGNVLFLVFDVPKSNDSIVNQIWVDSVLKAPHPSHVFAFGHKMAFFSGNHTDGLWTVPGQRDSLIKSLQKAGTRAMFFGHDHLYDHAEVTFPGWSSDQSIHQYVIGTAGAPFVNGKELTTSEGDWKLRRVAHVEKELGYAVIDVVGPTATIVYKSEKAPGQFTAVDTFSYRLP